MWIKRGLGRTSAIGVVAAGQLGEHRVVGGHLRVIVAFGSPVRSDGRAPVTALPLDQQRKQHHHERYLTGSPGDRTAQMLIAEKIKCPKCGADHFKGDYLAYTCAGCGLRIWKSIAGRELEAEEVRQLLGEGIVGPLEGFVSKMGRKFAACIKLNEEFKTEFVFDDASKNGKEPEDLSQCRVIADCPVCNKGRVYETEKSFVCENAATPPADSPPRPACTLRIGRVILQKQIPAEQVVKLLATGKTDLLPKFISKKGRPFSAFLILEKTGKVAFEFEPRKPKPAAKPAAKPAEK